MAPIEVVQLAGDDVVIGAGVVARALRDNPVNVAVFGDDRLERMKVCYDIFTGFMPDQAAPPLAARCAQWIVGVWAISPPGTCSRYRLPAELLTLPESVGPAGDFTRMQYWLATWAAHDPAEPHWHVGPVGVETGLQGLGIGGQMMDAFCRSMDESGEVAWLETDKPENVRFYSRGGFEVVEEIDLLGAPNWFMRRDPR